MKENRETYIEIFLNVDLLQNYTKKENILFFIWIILPFNVKLSIFIINVIQKVKKLIYYIYIYIFILNNINVFIIKIYLKSLLT